MSKPAPETEDLLDRDTPKRDYEVGYGKPPKASQFQPGRSGNPRGRRKGCKNGRTLWKEEIEAPIVVIESGKRIKTTKLGAIFKRSVNQALTTGEVKNFLEIDKRYGSNTGEETTERDIAVLQEEDVDTFESLIKRLKGEV